MTSYKDRTRQVLSGCRSVTLTERKNGFGMDESEPIFKYMPSENISYMD